MRYRVEIYMTQVFTDTVTVEAHNMPEAKKIALDQAEAGKLEFQNLDSTGYHVASVEKVDGHH